MEYMKVYDKWFKLKDNHELSSGKKIRISLAHILILARINQHRDCIATNAELAQLFDIPERRVAAIISDLKELGIITVEGEGNCRILKYEKGEL